MSPTDSPEMNFRDDSENNIQIPNGIVLRDNLTNVNIPPDTSTGYGTYLISWIASYTLLRNNVEIFALRNQQQQSIEGPNEFEYNTIEV
ncbi:395_t:CDS:2 [Diversispora eburnea]|uniref:395_t:CDS:1 n=1 Tax=Diversispora eburnea TaxID=1213867 RepID=A0A9N9FDD3_9GLOM|nr:395_t:CDS:2 [Diversispora eburnea]